ncbi:P-loop containing nucleoside triphosphate hydrolase protein [Tricharina praecox]|uniref:P-loop containing nucleoside triphosphate hydrolase protein n=1 Tax=Tricharina praecox TaxID=43433 RepID=UPI002220424F|nr:P-loop containing nucleoside triphosphate hydrolase protein [Tricharina praecox]KAI5856418.1 P-loop containing nucleoside triphosphate hydrolase protein [Tricharina praecox]
MLLLPASAIGRNICWRCELIRPHSAAALRPSTLSLKRPPPSLRRYASSTEAPAPASLAHTRNIGIIAHIDAGKTTTTERMLFYSGFTRRIGEVDEGSTVMDYLPAERARGITITSAAITFNWTPPSAQEHIINLIDTPGHADFTFEVERSIRVLDGAVTILDGVAGVEAQTEKVWRQAAKYQIPRLIFVNKLDRVGARFGATVREVAAKLNAWPAVLQLPVYENNGKGGEDVLRGVVDLVEKRVFLYELGGDGQNITVHDYEWLSTNNPKLHQEALDAQIALVELLGEHDEDLVELFLEVGEHHLIPTAALKSSIRKLTLTGNGRIIPVLCGASFRNIGVQPLLDAVVDYLPSPLDRPPTDITHSGNQYALLDMDTNRTCALAFKVVNDPKRGAMVFVRVYSGSLSKAQTLYNTSLGVKERAHRLLQMYADEAVDIPSIPCGHIGVIIGLKQARTGDTLISEHAVSPSGQSSNAKKSKTAIQKYDPKTLQLRPIDVPPPVFFASLEPYSLSEQKPLEEALAMLLREDPSFSVTTDPDSGQTLLSGMGELHLEIGRDRLVQELKAKADMGKILIAYRETISVPMGPTHHFLNRELAGKPAKAGCTASVSPLNIDDLEEGVEIGTDGNNVAIHILETYVDSTGETLKAKIPSHLTAKEIEAAMGAGVAAALSRGPHLHLPLRDTQVEVTINPATDLTAESSLAAISTATRLAVGDALAAAQAQATGLIVEPVMTVSVSCDEKDLGKVVADISSSRGGQVSSLGDGETLGVEIEMKRVYVPFLKGDGERREAGEGIKRVVNATVPLGEMVGYLKHLRAMTQGRGTFVMELEGWERMQGPRAREVEKAMRGE